MKAKKLILIVIIFLILFLVYIKFVRLVNYYDKNGLIYYPENRPKPQFNRNVMEVNENYTKEKIIFESKGAEIYGYLFLPNKKEKSPGIIFLPATQATKEVHPLSQRFF